MEIGEFIPCQTLGYRKNRYPLTLKGMILMDLGLSQCRRDGLSGIDAGDRPIFTSVKGVENTLYRLMAANNRVVATQTGLCAPGIGGDW